MFQKHPLSENTQQDHCSTTLWSVFGLSIKVLLVLYQLVSIMVKFYIVHKNGLVLNVNYTDAVEHAPFVVKEQYRLSSLVESTVLFSLMPF